MPETIKVALDTKVLDAIVANLSGGANRIVGMIAHEIEADAKIGMGTGPAGRTYGRGIQNNRDERGRFSGGKHQAYHVASAEPGPPAIDTSALINSIHASKIRNAYWQIGVFQLYGPFLEYGTPRMGPRPFMTPAIFKAKQTFNAKFKGLFK